MKPLRHGLIGTALLLAACSHGDGPQPATGARQQGTRQAETVRLLDTCPVTGTVALAATPPTPPGAPQVAPAAAPLVAAAIPVVAAIAADVAISAFKDWLARLDSERSGTFMAAGSGALPSARNPGRCLVVFRGRLGPTPANVALPPDSTLTADALRQAGLAAMPEFYFEARLRHTGLAPESRQDIVLEPQVLVFQETIARRARSEAKNLAIVIAIRRDTLDAGSTAAAARDKADAAFVLNLNEVVPGREIAPTSVPAPGSPPASGHPMLDLVRAARVGAEPGQHNVYAMVTEQADKAPLLGFLSAALANNSKPATEALAKAIADALKGAAGG